MTAVSGLTGPSRRTARSPAFRPRAAGSARSEAWTAWDQSYSLSIAVPSPARTDTDSPHPDLL